MEFGPTRRIYRLGFRVALPVVKVIPDAGATTNTVVKTQPATPATETTKDNSGFAKGNWVKVIKQGAELYSNKKVVARLQKDQELQVLGTNGSWIGVRVNINGNWERGWIRKTNVTD
jgi:hypothetical protein